MENLRKNTMKTQMHGLFIEPLMRFWRFFAYCYESPAYVKIRIAPLGTHLFMQKQYQCCVDNTKYFATYFDTYICEPKQFVFDLLVATITKTIRKHSMQIFKPT